MEKVVLERERWRLRLHLVPPTLVTNESLVVAHGAGFHFIKRELRFKDV